MTKIRPAGRPLPPLAPPSEKEPSIVLPSSSTKALSTSDQALGTSAFTQTHVSLSFQALEGKVDGLAQAFSDLLAKLADVPSKQAVEAFVKDTLAEYHARTTQNISPPSSSGSQAGALEQGLKLANTLFGGGSKGEASNVYYDVGKIVVDGIARRHAKLMSKEMGVPEHVPMRFTVHAEEPKA